MKTEILESLIWAGAIIILALGATVAMSGGAMEQDMAIRIVLSMNGIMLAWYGNRMPKAEVTDDRTRRANRISGRAFVAGGLVNSALMAFAPLDTAVAFGTGAIAVAAAIVVVNHLWLIRKVTR